MTRIRDFLKMLGLHWLSMLGAAITTTVFAVDLALIIREAASGHGNPYLGIIAYMILPPVIVVGLLLIPAGLWLRARREHKKLSWQMLQRLIQGAEIRRPRAVIQVVLLLTLANVVIFSLLTYRGYHYMESTAFCGEVCHEVMHPEFTTYQRSPHSEVECVQCHIGPGAGWFVKSKLSGARQVLAVTFDTFSRPIETPIHNLRPAREVCEVCHRPAKFHGSLIRQIEHFRPDEHNTQTYTILNMRVGSGGEHGREAHGIHWHVSDDNTIRYYATDHEREDIVWVELTRPDGTKRIWRRPGAEIPEVIPEEKTRRMDCVDCHNRPTHIYLPPETAIDEKLSSGELDAGIPWIRKVGYDVLTREYPTREAADAGIAEGVAAVYREQYPDLWAEYEAEIRNAIPVLQSIHQQFVFPEMNIQWNTYVSLIGHPTQESARCFRCHDGLMRDEQARTITIDCDACHYVLAQDAIDPAVLEVLEGEAIRFQRPGRTVPPQGRTGPATVPALGPHSANENTGEH